MLSARESPSWCTSAPRSAAPKPCPGGSPCAAPSALRLRAASGPAAVVQGCLEGDRRPHVCHAPLHEELRPEATGEGLGLLVRGVLARDLRGHPAERDDLAETLHGAEPGDEVLRELRRRIGWRAQDGEWHHGEACRRVARQPAGPVRAEQET